jgi:hypothetical protein
MEGQNMLASFVLKPFKPEECNAAKKETPKRQSKS